MSHSPEPWSSKSEVADDPSANASLQDAKGRDLIRTWLAAKEGNFYSAAALSADDGERIVACVNELAGVPDDLLKSGAVKKLLDELFSMPVKLTGPFPEAPMLEAGLNFVKQTEKPNETP